MRLNDVLKFFKALALSAAASNEFEAAAAELAVRRLVIGCNLDPTRIPNRSFIADIDFGDNPLLQKLREEYREQHPLPIRPARSARAEKSKSTAIPFNINGFNKHIHRKRREAAQLSREDHEKIRLLFNEGLTPAAINKRLGLRNANSTRAYHLRKGKWVRDDRGHFQWADNGPRYPR